ARRCQDRRLFPRHGEAGARSYYRASRTPIAPRSFEHGEAHTSPAIAVPVVEHVAASRLIEHRWIGEHLGVPPFTRGFDPGVRVSPPPRNAIERFRITDAISFAAVRVPHAIQPVSFPDDTGPSECILGAIREIDAHDAVTAPVQAVGRLSVS